MPDDRFLKSRYLVSALKRNHWESLRKDANVVGAAFGRRIAHGEVTEHPALVIYVVKKVPAQFLPHSRLLPRRLYLGGDCVEVDVVETGPFYPLSFLGRDRPAPSGISIGHTAITAGTLGCLVNDNTDRSLCILSNNHVLANQNAAAIGDAIVQPGPFDGGADPADRIATLKRFVTINTTGSTVDCAIAQVAGDAAGMVVDQMKNNLMPVPSPTHPAVGLLFAGSCNRTLMNQMSNVLSQLNIQFPAGPGSDVAPAIGMNVEKVGRTTEYTTSTITEIDVSATITYDFGSATLDHQVATAWMSDGGDSGSVICEGGKGGSDDHCGCGSTSAASSLLGVDLKHDACMANQVRDKYLRQTRIGRWAVDVFFLNEARLLDRFHRTEISQDDRDHARKMYDKYVDEARRTFMEAERSESRITEQHIRDARAALHRAQKYMSAEEKEASNHLLELGVKHAKGKNPRELLALLNDDTLFAEIKKTLAKVRTIRTSDESCD
ncbi:MAG TPA: hypothetical protein VGK32_05750 [Vicinamibacterales bacterium]|jgi:hypothetical protein